jgi:hypothetical protein
MATRPTRAVNLTKQMLAIAAVVRDARGRVQGGQLDCELRLQPTPASCVYTVRLAYRHGTRPKITVTDPALQLHPDAKTLPHVYTGDLLCLSYPGEWHEDMLLAHTVVPWISEWLVYYELWLATGEWLGGGAHTGHRRPTQPHGDKSAT